MNQSSFDQGENFSQYFLWKNRAPGAEGNELEDQPWFSVHLPPADIATGAAVVICPGGGYAFVSDIYEGVECAEWLNSFGVAAVVLRYRIAPRYHYPAPMLDAQQAVRVVRSESKKWGVDPKKIGIWGFSAGGHLASTVSNYFDAGNPKAEDMVGRYSCRPDFSILSYPVIMTNPPFAHAGSIINLLGKDPDMELLNSMSTDMAVTSKTPPTFLFHTDADEIVPSENSVHYYLALRRCGVPAEMHIYKNGPHGVGLGKDDPILSNWPNQLKNWLAAQKII